MTIKGDNVNFAPSFFLLQKEMLLVESALMSGLTALRNGSLAERGKLYTGFFQLSIGIERLLKLVLVIDFMVSNSLKPPTNDWLKKYGHNLERLYEAASSLAVASNIIMPLNSDSPEYPILRFLSVFAKNSRYYNLNALTERTSQMDPLSEWGKILKDTLENEVPKRIRETIMRQSAELANMVENHISVVAHDLDNQPLNLESVFNKPLLQQATAPFIIVRIFRIIAPIRKVLYDLGHKGYETTNAVGESRMHIPDFADMLVFTNAKPSDILRKKRWP
ncbi:MAG: hypothetical protein KC592_02865 [Nitrospira sp.]|nr:hypothetical protein [Nitrospira sp.]